MATLNVDLPEPLDRFVEDRVRSGSYHDAGEVVRAGLGLLQKQTERRRAKMERLERVTQQGLDDVEAERVHIVDDVPAWLDTLGRVRNSNLPA